MWSKVSGSKHRPTFLTHYLAQGSAHVRQLPWILGFKQVNRISQSSSGSFSELRRITIQLSLHIGGKEFLELPDQPHRRFLGDDRSNRHRINQPHPISGRISPQNISNFPKG